MNRPRTQSEVDEMDDLLTILLPFVEEMEKDPAYIPGAVAKLTKRIRAAIK